LPSCLRGSERPSGDRRSIPRPDSVKAVLHTSIDDRHRRLARFPRRQPRRSSILREPETRQSTEHQESLRYLPSADSVSRRSAHHGVTRQDREALMQEGEVSAATLSCRRFTARTPLTYTTPLATSANTSGASRRRKVLARPCAAVRPRRATRSRAPERDRPAATDHGPTRHPPLPPTSAAGAAACAAGRRLPTSRTEGYTVVTLPPLPIRGALFKPV